jgi:undecaprenyl-diphosphatase
MINRIRVSIKKSLAGIALLSAELIIVLVLFICALVGFVFVAYRIFNLQNDHFDFVVFDTLAGIVSEPLTRFMQFITFLGNHQFLVPANLVLIAYFLFVKRRRWYSIKVPVIALGGVLLMYILKQIFNRSRPLVPLLEPVQGLSFPSGHALMSMSFYGLLIFIVWENITNQFWKWTLSSLLLLLILCIGFSRIYLRLHYFSDVIAGFAAGIIWLSLSIWVVRRFERFSRKEIDPVVRETGPTN